MQRSLLKQSLLSRRSEMIETYKLMRLEDDKVVDDIELTKWEFKQALTCHKRMKQRKER